VIVHVVTQALQRLFEVLFEKKSRVVRANRDAHGQDCTMKVRA
jgi:hypothetical protein